MSESDLRAISADSAMSAAARTRSVVDGYLKEMSVPAKYADAMFAIPKDGVKWVDSGSFKADLNGFIPELSDWVGARCNEITSNEKKIWDALSNKSNAEQTAAEKLMTEDLLKKWDEQFKCEYKLQTELSMRAYSDALKAGKLK